jgi:hypothetical protein
MVQSDEGAAKGAPDEHGSRSLPNDFVWATAEFGAKTFVQLPDWLTIMWMVGCALAGYILAPYEMWKQQRAQIASLNMPNRKEPESTEFPFSSL